MANRRMFAKAITESDAFTDMPLSTQALYFHLGMSADDDGFVNNPKRVQRSIGASNDDLSLLAAKGFIIPFDSGIVVIKHWKINNWIQSDRYRPTKYSEERELLEVKSNKAYTLKDTATELVGYTADTSCIQDVSETDTQVRLGKDRLGKRYTLSGKPDVASEVEEIVGYLNAKVGSGYKPTSKKTRSLIAARLNEGFGVDDFKTVIDKKSSDWLNDPSMSRYLRPETLFGTKFEGYLNESMIGGRDDRYAKYR